MILADHIASVCGFGHSINHDDEAEDGATINDEGDLDKDAEDATYTSDNDDINDDDVDDINDCNSACDNSCDIASFGDGFEISTCDGNGIMEITIYSYYNLDGETILDGDHYNADEISVHENTNAVSSK